jgi:hypothetical protein
MGEMLVLAGVGTTIDRKQVCCATVYLRVFDHNQVFTIYM